MRKLLRQVREFHTVGRLRVGEHAGVVIDVPDDAALVRVAAEVLHGEAFLLARTGKGSLAIRARLMIEELAETLEAAARGDLVETADGLADLAYVTAGTAVEWGIPLAEVLDEVHRSNMAKFPECTACGDLTMFCEACEGLGRVRLLDESGKVMKPPGWTPPDVAGVLDKHKAF